MNGLATLDHANEILNSSNSRSINGIRSKSVGIKLALVGMAEAYASRIRSSEVTIRKIEERILSEEVLNRLDDREMIGLYRIVTDYQSKMSDFLSKCNKEVDMTEIETELLDVSVKQNVDQIPTDVKDLALEMLKYIKPVIKLPYNID